MKAGWKTTEFWFSALAALCGLVLASGWPAESPWVRAAGMLSAALTAIGYGHSRAAVKTNPTNDAIQNVASTIAGALASRSSSHPRPPAAPPPLAPPPEGGIDGC